MSNVIEGVKFSDQLAALLGHARANGFRIEAATAKGRAASGAVTVYPADKTHPPITVTEIKGKFNRSHYENVRRDLYRAGCPPLPADARTAADEVKVEHIHNASQLTARLRADQPDRPDIIAGIVGGVFGQAEGYVGKFDSLAASIAYAVATAAEELGSELTALAADSSATLFQSELDEALALAAAAETRADNLQKELDRADARAEQAVTDCRAALRRAEAAEARAAEAEAAMAPLRAYLSAAPAGPGKD